jgi:hypothetical protein
LWADGVIGHFATIDREAEGLIRHGGQILFSFVFFSF